MVRIKGRHARIKTKNARIGIKTCKNENKNTLKGKHFVIKELNVWMHFMFDLHLD